MVLCNLWFCTINAWFICPESYNPDATLNDWSMCTFTWDGCATASAALPSPGSYPTIELTDVTDDTIDAYYYLGAEKIGCMDRRALNYVNTAVLQDGSCVYEIDAHSATRDLKVHSGQGFVNIIINDTNNEALYENDMFVYDLSGKIVYSGFTKKGQIININTDNWISGVYYVVIKMENRNITHKFAVE